MKLSRVGSSTPPRALPAGTLAPTHLKHLAEQLSISRHCRWRVHSSWRRQLGLGTKHRTLCQANSVGH